MYCQKEETRDCSRVPKRGEGRDVNAIQRLKRRRAKPTMPIRPVPSKPRVLGSGTTVDVDDVVKHVGLVPQAVLATWRLTSVTSDMLDPVRVAPVSSRVREDSVALPVVSKQSASECPNPPQAPDAKPMVLLMPSPVRLLPEKPTVGPPARMVLLPTAVMVTHISLLGQVPPVVTVAVATSVVPTKRLKELAEATGTITNAAPMTSARIESLRLVIRTHSPFRTSNTLCKKDANRRGKGDIVSCWRT